MPTVISLILGLIPSLPAIVNLVESRSRPAETAPLTSGQKLEAAIALCLKLSPGLESAFIQHPATRETLHHLISLTVAGLNAINGWHLIDPNSTLAQLAPVVDLSHNAPDTPA